MTRNGKTGVSRPTALIVVACVAAIVVLAMPAKAVTSLEGYSDLMLQLTSGKGGDPAWQLGNPRLYAEFRLKSSPWTDIDTFLKVSAESDRWSEDLKDTRLFLNEAHMRFHGSRVEAHLFTGQDRFWLNEPLLAIVDQGMVKHDDWGVRAQGVRLDFWDVFGIHGAAFYSERSDYVSKGFAGMTDELEYYPGTTEADTVSSSTDDYRGLRLNRRFLGDEMLFGATYARKDFNETAFHGSAGSYDEVFALDSELALGELVPFLTRFGRVTWATEYGLNNSGWLDDSNDSGVAGFKTEIRDIRAGPIRLLASYGDYGERFYTDGLASEDRRNLNGYTKYYAEAHYRLSRKAVNLKYWTYREEPKDYTISEYGVRQEWGTEAYVEFVNGFTGKAEYKVHENKDGIWPNLFFEVTGENRLVKLRTQFRIRDVDTVYEVAGYGFEANVNLSDNWKFYARVMNVSEQTESRQTAFAQVRYLGWSGAEFFVEYGNPDHSNELANDGDFVSHGSGAVMEKVFKAFIRVYY
ncbi:hypothetical protein H8D73_02490 [bacterium]|nr:hypothetical protein [bacterium]